MTDDRVQAVIDRLTAGPQWYMNSLHRDTLWFWDGRAMWCCYQGAKSRMIGAVTTLDQIRANPDFKRTSDPRV